MTSIVRTVFPKQTQCSGDKPEFHHPHYLRSFRLPQIGCRSTVSVEIFRARYGWTAVDRQHAIVYVRATSGKFLDVQQSAVAALVSFAQAHGQSADTL
jgi:hypothetical protein